YNNQAIRECKTKGGCNVLKTVTWILRILSTGSFILMCWFVYTFMSGNWDWDAPYIFIVTVFRLISMVLFFIGSLVMAGLVAPLTGFAPGEALVGLYNTQLLRMWYMQPYGVSGPFTNVNQIFTSFFAHIGDIWFIISEYSFTFMYFLGAALGIALFLQSLFRMEHKYVGGAFISIQSILIIGAYRMISTIPHFTDGFPTDFMIFLGSNVQLLALISFAYLEISYQMIYSHSVGKPVEDREETLKKQLLALRRTTRKQDAIERGEKISTTAMSRTSGATAFSFVREAIERRVVGEKEVIENLDAVADVRRLQIFVDDLLITEPTARDELTAKAAAPSSGYVITSTITGTAFRFIGVLSISFIFMNPLFFTAFLNLPPGIENSVEILQPELLVFFMAPILFLFVLVAMIISWNTSREIAEKPDLTPEEKEKVKQHKKELALKRKAAKKARQERAKAKKKRTAEGDGKDVWDKALEDTYKM
ncbi:MAG: hypothetical protein P1Q69_19080, partial [Candidatus Thorarchaeota archaeon]|nr:hypothetical protein [Candidatus Thorarchaeota archaeon]